MDFPVIKGASYILVDTPDMLINNGTTQMMEREINPDSEYIKHIKEHIRSFDDVVSYPPNQVYIGNITPDALSDMQMPWYNKEIEGSSRWGKYGEIMPEDEFYGLLKISDSFELVMLEKEFAKSIKEKLSRHPVLNYMSDKVGDGVGEDEILKNIRESNAEKLELDGRIIGCVKRAHEFDPNLSSHIMVENLSVKASGALALINLIRKSKISPGDIDYIIECSEEAIGDMNQRGGGNMAKSIGEIAGCTNASGIDLRGFCAGPAHSVVHACALVKAGIFKNVVVLGGGSTAKLGMNGRDHFRKGMPLMEDVLGGFALLVSENDGVNPVVRTDMIGKHDIGSGASPQAVIDALVNQPLKSAGMKMTDIDKYSPEMQNPECTEPAGAGNVPMANFKMIAALAVKYKQIERSQLMEFAKKHGNPGFAPTQGHVPSGVPIIGFARDFILEGKIKSVMVIGKGSLFLGRMTNLFDGISFVIQKNSGKTDEGYAVSKDEIKGMIAQAFKDFASTLLSK